MASSYDNELRLNEMATGDASGTWGTTTNVNLNLIGEALGYGTEGITTNADTHTSTIADGATDPVRAMYVEYTGTLDSACTITIAPNTVNRMQFIENGTSGSQNIIISQGSGANITIPPGDVKAVYLDGAGSGAAVVDAFASLNVVDLKVQDDLTVTDDVIIGGDIDLEGSIDVNGTANLDVVDIDGAVDMASTLTVAGVLTGASLDISGNIDVDGTTNLDNTDIDGTLDVSGQVTFADGSAGAPSISNTGDVNAGLFFSAADVMSFSAGGTAQFTMADGSISPVTDNDIDLGTASLKYKSFFAGLTDSENFKVNGGQGDDGQVLTSTGSGVAWEDASGGATDIDGLSDAKSGGTNFSNSLFLGHQTTGTLSNANNNTAVGYGAMDAVTAGADSTAIGKDAMTTATTSDSSTAVGTSSMYSTTTGNDNTAVGWRSLYANTTGPQNVAVGKSALVANTTGEANTGIGYNALDANTTASNNTAVGANALTSCTTGANNTAVGFGAGDAVTTGDQNVYIGQDTGGASTTGSNTAVGAAAFSTQILGTRNTAIGYGAMQVAGGDGSSNLLVNNTAVGHQAMYNHDKDDCTCVGMASLFTMTTGTRNVALGGGAGYSITSGADNTTLGLNAGYDLTTGSNNTAVGKGTIFSAVNVTNEIVIGSGRTGIASNTAFIGGTSGAYNGENNSAWSTTSDKRIKKNITDKPEGLDAINQIRVRNFEYRTEEEIVDFDNPKSALVEQEGIQLGVIAQEIELVLPELVKELNTGVKVVNPTNLTWYLVNAVQELTTQVETLKTEVATLKGE